MVSIKDVAKRAGVAISTVSKVLNGYPNVSEETRQRVNKAVEELNFVPNSVAAALSSKQAGRVALLINSNMKTNAIDEGWPYLAANSLRFPLSCSEPTYRLQPLPYWGCLRSSVQSGCSVIRTAGNVRRWLTWSFQSKAALSSRCNSVLRSSGLPHPIQPSHPLL